MDLYLDGSAVLRLYDSNKWVISQVSGSTGNGSLQLKNPQPGAPPNYPMYEIITINGVSDVVEHRALEPIFYMTDDPKVLEELHVPANKRLERP
jgi:hypothetical protein